MTILEPLYPDAFYSFDYKVAADSFLMEDTDSKNPVVDRGRGSGRIRERGSGRQINIAPRRNSTAITKQESKTPEKPWRRLSFDPTKNISKDSEVLLPLKQKTQDTEIESIDSSKKSPTEPIKTQEDKQAIVDKPTQNTEQKQEQESKSKPEPNTQLYHPIPKSQMQNTPADIISKPIVKKTGDLRNQSTQDTLWYYIDPKKIERGPFSSANMEKWLKHYFPVDLQIRRESEVNFTALGHLFLREQRNPFTNVPLTQWLQTPPISELKKNVWEIFQVQRLQRYPKHVQITLPKEEKFQML